jgi:DNA repair protein SbcC/Rad50
MIGQWSSRRASLHRLVEELRSHGEVDCPNCQHHFYLESGRLEELELKLDELDKIKAPHLSRREIAAELCLLDDWELKRTQDQWNELKDAVECHSPRVTQGDIDTWRRGNAAAAERGQIETRVAEIGQVSNYYEAALETRLAYEEQERIYVLELHRYSEWLEQRRQAESRAALLELLSGKFSKLGLLKIEWTRYRDQWSIWNEAACKVGVLRVEADGWRAAQTALNNLRVMVKGHLVPALSRVASGLVAQMTGGQRNWITVDEDFDVLVDGQRLDTLSGSGKAVANLALRIGLGQVLTNNVLSVFIGDEIDASMDDTRAENLGECMVTLVNKISQIILITHKSQVDADWCVNLGNGEWMT